MVRPGTFWSMVAAGIAIVTAMLTYMAFEIKATIQNEEWLELDKQWNEEMLGRLESLEKSLVENEEAVSDIRTEVHVNYTRFEELEQDLNILTLEVGRHSGQHEILNLLRLHQQRGEES